MSERIRSLVITPLAIVAFVAFFSLLLSVGNPERVQGQTAPTAPTGTVPATATSTPGPTRPAPTPTAPARPGPTRDARARANGWILEKVVGNRLISTIYGVALAPRLYRSSDDGATWSLVARGESPVDFLVSPANPNVLYSNAPIDCADGSESAPLQRSSDGGARWQMLMPGFDVQPLIADPGDANILIGAGCDGLYRSEDGGWSWMPLSTMMDAPIWQTHRAQKIEAVYFAGGDEATLDNLYVLAVDEAGNGAVLYSDDGGVTWLEVSPMGAELVVEDFAIDPWTVGRVWLSEATGVWQTEDQGDFWTLSARGLEDALEAGISAIVFHADDLLYVGSGAGVYTKESGETAWSPAGSGIVQQQTVDGLLLTDSAPAQIWVNSAHGVYLLRD